MRGRVVGARSQIAERCYRLRWMPSGRRRLDGTQGTGGGYVLAVPTPLVDVLCELHAASPDELRLQPVYHPVSGELVYRVTRGGNDA